ncbi:unnamed protein product [Parajaminaea phylloscopi]
MNPRRPASGGSWDQGTLHHGSASTPPLETAPPQQWGATQATSAAAAYQGPYTKEAYYHEAESLYPRDEHAQYPPSTAGRTAVAPAAGRPPHYPYGGAGFHRSDSPSSAPGSPGGTKSTARLNVNTSVGQQPAAYQVRQRPGGLTPRSRRNSYDWAKLMKDAGYTWEPADEVSRGGAGSGMATDGQVKGPLSWLRSVFRGSLVLSWFICIVPVLAILWVPGIIALVVYDARPNNNFDKPQVWNTGIFWWSVWLSGVWLGWWICRAASGLLPRMCKKVVGSVAVASDLGLKKMIDYIIACEFYVALFLQTVLVWVLWLTTVWHNFHSPSKNAVSDGANPLTSNSTMTATPSTAATRATTTDSTSELMVTISRFWFGLCLCTALLLVEKVLIQAIAFGFHQSTYADRLAASKFQIAALSTLFSNSSSSLQRRDTVLEAEGRQKKKGSRMSLIPFAGATRSKGIMTPNPNKYSRPEAQSRNTVLGNVAVELREQKVLLQGSPKYVVLSALESAKETRRLARRIFYSFSQKDPQNPNGPLVITPSAFAPCFPEPSTANAAFSIFDKDSNGSLTREEMEASCLEISKDRQALANSMHDVDSAVSSLDSCFMSVFVLIAAVIVAAMLSTKFSTLVTSLGSVVLGLSWLFSASAAESFSAVVFLIAKHPYDTGDRVDIQGYGTGGAEVGSFEVVELGLLSTIFKDLDGKYVQISNAQLSQKAITNHRRSGPIEEPFKLDVAYTTSLMQLESLRNKMVTWLENEGRDYRPGLNISISSLGDQSKMTISMGIRYKSNWQDGGLKARRRNRWICTLSAFLRELEIFGPSGDPNTPPITRVAMVDAPAAAAAAAAPAEGGSGKGSTSTSPPEYRLMDSKQAEATMDGAQTPGGLGGGGSSGLQLYGTSTGGYNTPARAESPPPLPTAQQTGGAGAAQRRRPMGGAAAAPPSQQQQVYEMGRMA